MRAARLHPDADRLRLDEVAVPEPSGDGVLVRITATGVCQSDLHIIDGELDSVVMRPVTPGHEIAGRVAATGHDVDDLATDEPVAVMVGWGCGHCRWCVSGHEQLCPDGHTAGATTDGGFAEYVLVPHRRNVVPLGDIDPLDATPLGCAALSSYAAIKRARDHIAGGSLVVVIGAGGLGQYAVQFARTMTGAAVAVVEPRAIARERALACGADHAVAPGPEAAVELHGLSNGAGAAAVIDLVGSDETLTLAAEVVGTRGIVTVLGVAGGSLPFSFGLMAREASIATVYAGTVADLQEVVAMAQVQRFSTLIETYPLEEINAALDDLRAGSILGRAVVTPGA